MMKAYQCTTDLFADVDLGIKNAVLMCVEGPAAATKKLCGQLAKSFVSAGYEEDGAKAGDLVVFFVVKKSGVSAFVDAATQKGGARVEA
ncbi:hypothetical protein [Serratia fonticola]|uniref:hypothetical protein n=1 Tax=Serratia fonticola TaxID=47917 RepID=UPI00192D0005|nr:hypothetical protein [Serratia fonticola]MBL5825385.1 hypothetical protein [Serratia fonticola]